MPEPTPSITLAKLQSEVGFMLGYGRGANYDDAAWDTRQQQAIDSCVESGLYKFYFPPRVADEKNAHAWSFLKPVATLTLAAGASAIDLPADFNGLEGDIIISTPSGQATEALRQINPVQLDLMAAQGDATTGRPEAAAIRPTKGTGLDRGQRYQLAVWPTAEQEYTLRLAYTVAPDFLTTANPYPYGGPTHRETLLESCLAVAEARLDANAGMHNALFIQQLEASISHDRRFQPRSLGYNGDGMRDDDSWSLRRWPTVTFEDE